jgi:hypothetical protein
MKLPRREQHAIASAPFQLVPVDGGCGEANAHPATPVERPPNYNASDVKTSCVWAWRTVVTQRFRACINTVIPNPPPSSHHQFNAQPQRFYNHLLRQWTSDESSTKTVWPVPLTWIILFIARPIGSGPLQRGQSNPTQALPTQQPCKTPVIGNATPRIKPSTTTERNSTHVLRGPTNWYSPKYRSKPKKWTHLPSADLVRRSLAPPICGREIPIAAERERCNLDGCRVDSPRRLPGLGKTLDMSVWVGG